MVKILANGEIVPDNDPRATATQRRQPQASQAFGAQPARIASATSGGGSSSGASAGSSSGGGMHSLPADTEENVIKGDLARALGIYGRVQQVGSHEVPLVYLVVGAVLALLWVSGQMNVLRMLVLGFVLYVMFRSYQKAQASGLSPAQAFFGGAGGAGGPGGDDGKDNSSGGSVINRGGRPR
eukprot:TRINITY_DN16986_c0_g2_i1.p1 TRINITY_DN16986_c0_g2~~TRINITY_DN16986_c0_g2_i1.p1  ORF type:complete len:182 (-),score=35.76 TRINITY_DN16986_c0_g2_i1:133-678(-)